VEGPPLKRSIFKSKAIAAAAAPKKALSLYRHKLGWGGEQQEEFGGRPNTRGDNHTEKGQSERGVVGLPTGIFFQVLPALLRIHEILVRTRIRIC
jgi:hypothetical protein